MYWIVLRSIPRENFDCADEKPQLYASHPSCGLSKAVESINPFFVLFFLFFLLFWLGSSASASSSIGWNKPKKLGKS